MFCHTIFAKSFVICNLAYLNFTNVLTYYRKKFNHWLKIENDSQTIKDENSVILIIVFNYNPDVNPREFRDPSIAYAYANISL